MFYRKNYKKHFPFRAGTEHIDMSDSDFKQLVELVSEFPEELLKKARIYYLITGSPMPPYIRNILDSVIPFSCTIKYRMPLGDEEIYNLNVVLYYFRFPSFVRKLLPFNQMWTGFPVDLIPKRGESI